MIKEPIPSVEGEREESDIAKLEKFISRAAMMYANEGIPVRSNGRIDLQAYADMYPDTRKDAQRIEEWEKEWFGDMSEAQKAEKRRNMEGEQLEMLSYAVFIKNLGDEFVVVRSSPHDDRENKVDTLLLSRETGALVCAFDEVGATSGKEYEDKLSLVQRKNLGGGAKLKYGISAKRERGISVVVKAAAGNIPVFYIALPSDRIKKGMEEFSPEISTQSDFEKKLFEYFSATLIAQIQALELYSRRLNPELKKRLGAFKKIIKSQERKRT